MKKILTFLILLLFAGNISASEIPADFSFSENIKLKDRGVEVKYLQIFLNNHSDYKVAESGSGSLDNETEYFGYLTKQAVIRFQEEYFDEILAPWGFSRGTGIVGPTTKAKMNSILSNKNNSSDYYISSLSPYQGDVIIVKVFNTEPDEVVTASFLNKTYTFYSNKTERIVVIPINSKITPGKYSLSIYNDSNLSFVKVINVLDSNFPTTKLTITTGLEEEGYSISSIQENVLIENQTLFLEALNDPISEFYFDDDFIYPLSNIENVGAFGNIRCSGDVCLQHLGVDLDAEEGASVYSINNGIVKFVKETTNYGKTIIVDHGGGIRSIYLHLSEFLVREGEVVSKGQIIAYSGNTGYSIAPHLHLSINIYGYSIDPLNFIKTVNDELNQ